jgi:hypothetical protein
MAAYRDVRYIDYTGLAHHESLILIEPNKSDFSALSDEFF